MRSAFCVLMLSAWLGCTPLQTPLHAAPAPTLQGLRYVVRVHTNGIEQLDVSLCFDGPPPRELVYGTRNAARFLRDAHMLQGGSQALALQDGVLQLPPLAAGSCLAYTIDVQAALDFDALMLAYPGDGALLLGTELFLWRPVKRSPSLQSTLRFELPEGVQVSVPWHEDPARAGTFQLDERAFAFTGHVALGRFDQHTLPVTGGTMRAIILPGFPAEASAVLTAWLQRSAIVASLPGAAFPVADAQVIIAPTSPSPFPIHFGHTGRSGGASIVLFVPTDIGADALQADWIAVHEFSHLWHPFIRRDDAWLSEGLATYLQEVLRARAGLVTPAAVWQRLYEGAQLGRETTHDLSEETRRMAFESNYRRVYWAGAAIALMIDVELRKASAGRLSLDGLLARLRREPALYLAGMSAQELLGHLDRLAGVRACEPIAARYTSGSLPDLSALYRELGVIPGADASEVRFDAHAPSAALRDAIMTGAPWQECAGVDD